MDRIKANRCSCAARAGLVLALLALGGCSDGPRVAKGTYRLPFSDGTTVAVLNSFFNHNGEFDLYTSAIPRGAIAAAAPGWLRFIEDSHAEPTSLNNYVWIEHPYPYCQPPGVSWPGKPANYDATCVPCYLDHCNEWTKYSHMATGSVTTPGVVLVDGDYYAGAGLTVGEWVDAGTYLGVESDVGQADGIHVHWEVVILNPGDPITPDGFSKDWTGGDWQFSPNLIPYVCTGPNGDTPVSPYLLEEGDAYDSQPCGVLSQQELADRQLVERATDEASRAQRDGHDVADALSALARTLPPRVRTRALAESRRILDALEARPLGGLLGGALDELRELLERLATEAAAQR